MLLSRYGLRESPFGVTPDPRFLYASEAHREALASLLYGIDSGLGFMLLTAMPGMGKTTLLFEVLNSICYKAVTVFLFQTISTPVELLRGLLSELGISCPQGGLLDLQAQLNELLIKCSEEGKRIVVVIDEAQNLNDAVLEQVRVLSNFETSREKLMQIILAGQLQLTERLASPELLQLRQRISIVARLEPLSMRETAAYIQHRLTVAGYHDEVPLFDSSAVAMIARQSEGIPRSINNLCSNALSLACALRETTIGPDVIREVIADLDLRSLAGRVRRRRDSDKLAILNVPGSDVDKPKWRTSVLTTAGVFGVLVLVFGFTSMGFQRTIQWRQSSDMSSRIAPHPISSSSLADPPTPTVEASTKPHEAPTMAAPAQSLIVQRGQSLRRICAMAFGHCSQKVFRALLEANPQLSNPRHILPGQKIFLPPSPPPSNNESGPGDNGLTIQAEERQP